MSIGGTTGSPKLGEHLADIRKWLLPAGIALVLVGIAVAILPFLGSLAVEQVIGWAFGIAGVIQFAHAFQAKGWGTFVAELVNGAIFLVAGITLVAGVAAGAVSLSIVVVAVFLAGGIVQVVLGYRLRPLEGWYWFMLLGLISILVAVFLFNEYVSSSARSAGLLLGADLIATGVLFLRMWQLQRDDPPLTL